jgi:lysozyme
MIIPPVPQQAYDLVRQFEGLRLQRYMDVDGYGTIGYGHLCHPNDGLINISMETAENLLEQDIMFAACSVIRMTDVPLNDNQYSALIDFVYNLGPASYQRSTLRQKINRKEFKEIYNEFKKWVYGNGVIIPGLKVRRQTEAMLFLKDYMG